MPRTPSLDALRIFVVAARHLSFTEAASELNLTQSAISHRIRGLEAGAQAYIVKSQFNQSNLLETVQQLLGT